MQDSEKKCHSSVSKFAGMTVLEIVIILVIFGILIAVMIPSYHIMIKPPEKTILAAADKELAKLDWQEMAYSAPDRMEIGSTAIVDIALGGNKTFAELIPLLENAGKVEGQRVQVSERMEARLTGDGFEIIAITPETQLVSTLQVTKWQWQVKAKNIGKQDLNLSLNVLLSLNGKDTTKSVRTFQRKITIQVTTIKGAWGFVERYWVYISLVLTAIIIPIAAHFWKKRNKNKTGKTNKSDETKPSKTSKPSGRRKPPKRPK